MIYDSVIKSRIISSLNSKIITVCSQSVICNLDIIYWMPSIIKIKKDYKLFKN